MSDVPEAANDHPVVLFDGVCNLCNDTVQFLIEQDDEGVLRFAPLQSEPGQALLAASGHSGDDLESIVLVDDGTYYEKSDAALRIAEYLEMPLSWAGNFRAVPRPIRDTVYDLVATYRYDVFGKRDQCMIPSPEVRSRFLAMDDATADGD